LGAGLAGGADVILIPEIPYDANKVGEAILERSRGGKRLSIVAVSEGAMSIEDALIYQDLLRTIKKAGNEAEKAEAEAKLLEFQLGQNGKTMRLAQRLEALTGLESRVTILGYVQRGGTPSALDRLLATELGTSAAALIAKGVDGVMVSIKGKKTQPVPLEEVVGKRKVVPNGHTWLKAARRVGTCLGD
jgi:6-phosphofructokinase 1